MDESSQSLKQRISGQLTRIIRGYVILITSLLALTTLLLGYSFKLNLMSHQRQLVSTKISTELSSIAYELQSLSTSTLVWTGLSDSMGRDGYLEPLLSRFNRDKQRKFLILDYRGRVLSSSEQAWAQEVARSTAVQQAVAQGSNGQGMMQSIDGRPFFVLVHRVMSPQSEFPVGFIVGTLDAADVARSLELRGVTFSFALGADRLLPEPSGRMMLREQVRELIRRGDHEIELRIQMSEPMLPFLALALPVFLLAFLAGYWILSRISAWARQFSGATTERLDQLVIYCQKVLAGEATAPVPEGPRDEIAQVAETLSTMLRQQKQITDELRTTSLVFSTAAEGIIVTDGHGRIVDVNPALLRMTGFHREELIGRQAGALYRTQERDADSQEIAQALAVHGRWSGETSFLDCSGRDIPTSTSISRIPGDDGGSIGHVAVITDVGRLKEAENKLRDLAYRDALTGLPNLRMMGELVRERLQLRPQQPFLLMFVDLDHLKTINDTYGHEAGDWMIRGVAEHLAKELPSGSLLCRRSGDEFIALVDMGEGLERSHWVALLARIASAQVMLPAGPVAVSASIGVACYPDDALCWDDLQVCADVAMNAAKQTQRGTVAWYDNRLGQKVMRQRLVHQKLAQALDTHAIRVHYQPVVDLASGRLLGFEALARWRDPDLGNVRPDEFIAVAEDAQLSDQLTLQVLGIILRDKPLIQQRFPGTVLAFNAAPRVFRDMKVIDFLARRLDDDPQLLCDLEVELTETHIASSEDHLLNQLQLLTNMGVHLVIDDFGKGYSSLSRLAQYPIRCVKIDASFVSKLGEGQRHNKIVELIVNLAQVLGLQVTAEGVETPVQREILLRMGCTRGQGWLFAKAMPIDDLLGLPECLQETPVEAAAAA